MGRVAMQPVYSVNCCRVHRGRTSRKGTHTMGNSLKRAARANGLLANGLRRSVRLANGLMASGAVTWLVHLF